MIVREHGDQFLMIKQHDHALISGEMVLQWKKTFLLRSKLREEADWAIAQHDAAWIPLDEHPKWNDEKNQPYTFIDYPLKEKLDAYCQGIEEISKQTLYGAMLCSMHYQSFFSRDSEDARIREFVEAQEQKQEQLFNQMSMEVPKDIYQLHFKRLQFCDDLSLYICMQEPGAAKEEEISWFKDGFPQVFDFAPQGIKARWVDESKVAVHPFPFEKPFKVAVPYKLVSKEEIRSSSLEQAFHQAKERERLVHFFPEEKA